MDSLDSLSAGERILVVSREERQTCCRFTYGEYSVFLDLHLGVLNGDPINDEGTMQLPMDRYLKRTIRDGNFKKYGIFGDGGLYSFNLDNRESTEELMRGFNVWNEKKGPLTLFGLKEYSFIKGEES